MLSAVKVIYIIWHFILPDVGNLILSGLENYAWAALASIGLEISKEYWDPDMEAIINYLWIYLVLKTLMGLP